MDKALLVLDLDETLVFATDKSVGRKEDFKIDEYLVYNRPFLEEFLDFVFKNFEVVVWTSSSKLYADEICPHIFNEYLEELKFVYSRKKCTYKTFFETGKSFNVKPLKKVFKLGYDKNRVLSIDDDFEKYADSYGNLIKIKAFNGEADDKELLKLKYFLDSIKDIEDLRSLEKRGWENKVKL